MKQHRVKPTGSSGPQLRPWSTVNWRRRHPSYSEAVLAGAQSVPKQWRSPLWNARLQPEFLAMNARPSGAAGKLKYGVSLNEALPAFGQGPPHQKILHPIGHEREGHCVSGKAIGMKYMCSEEEILPKTQVVVSALPTFANVIRGPVKAMGKWETRERVQRKESVEELGMGMPVVNVELLKKKFEIPDVVDEKTYTTLSDFAHLELASDHLTRIEHHFVQKGLLLALCTTAGSVVADAAAFDGVLGGAEKVPEAVHGKLGSKKLSWKSRGADVEPFLSLESLEPQEKGNCRREVRTIGLDI